MGSSVIEFKDLTKKYGSFTAVDCLNLSISKGEIFGLLGPNGAGKSTLLNLVAGTLLQNKGEIKLSGDIISNQPEYQRARWIGRVFQNPLFQYPAGLICPFSL